MSDGAGKRFRLGDARKFGLGLRDAKALSQLGVEAVPVSLASEALGQDAGAPEEAGAIFLLDRGVLGRARFFLFGEAGAPARGNENRTAALGCRTKSIGS